jgi:hypothetical protein
VDWPACVLGTGTAVIRQRRVCVVKGGSGGFLGLDNLGPSSPPGLHQGRCCDPLRCVERSLHPGRSISSAARVHLAPKPITRARASDYTKINMSTETERRPLDVVDEQGEGIGLPCRGDQSIGRVALAR